MSKSWINKMMSCDFHATLLEKYPGWDKVKEEDLAFVMLELTAGKGRLSSLNMTSRFDDMAEGRFYYRDWTKDSIPVVNEGEVYWSGFWFERLSDAKKFAELYGGKGNWEDGYEKFEEECNRKRNGSVQKEKV